MKQFLIFFIIALFISACETNPPQSSNVSESKGIYVELVDRSSSDKKIALVVGNRLYNYGTLTNTVNDATDVAAILRKIGFEVIFKTDLNQRQMDEAIYSFKQRLSKNNGVGFFYFSGHGARVAGINYLLPIDNDRIRSADDLEYYAIDARKVLKVMQSARNNVNIIVLDACRDNPYSVVGKSLNRGLGKMDPPRGSIISFATDAGRTASDISKNGRNGLFASHLVKALDRAYKNHQRVDDMFMDVSREVTRESGGKQEPWQLDSLKDKFCFGGCKVANVVPNPPPVSSKKVFQDRLRDGSLGPKMVVIPASSISMGKFEVTVGEFRKFINETGYKTDAEQQGNCWAYNNSWKNINYANWRNPKFFQNDNHPAVCISWNDATAYTEWLSNQTAYTYRLPTEAEWEFAARKSNLYNICLYANVADQTAKTKFRSWKINNCTDGYVSTSPVGSFQTNKFGLSDMLGNVWEWTCSEFTEKYNGKEKVCISKNSNKNRVQRGGSWYDLRANNRYGHTPDIRNVISGFRVARIN